MASAGLETPSRKTKINSTRSVSRPTCRTYTLLCNNIGHLYYCGHHVFELLAFGRPDRYSSSVALLVCVVMVVHETVVLPDNIHARRAERCHCSPTTQRFNLGRLVIVCEKTRCGRTQSAVAVTQLQMVVDPSQPWQGTTTTPLCPPCLPPTPVHYMPVVSPPPPQFVVLHNLFFSQLCYVGRKRRNLSSATAPA